MGEGKPSLRWSVEQKLQFIEFRLFWEGHVNRADLMDTFGVSLNQASGDLNRYIALAPDNMVYDKSGKTYVRSPAFSPHFLKPDASQYLAQVRSVRRQNIRHNSRRRLAECGPRQGVDVRRRTCGAASADVRWSVA